ncbi:NAD-dependent epimerase/dehydratase family protein [Azohydromonas caseinilytica]|uniref:NAD-dependent epimerase/dehydratase family protein n=1 Tax=Azohydromonas caseinilytica TaxID=2728836 RepID=A0A848FC28_9BURK|nr:NAD-dependent epimerase/dehydratase family protein [Azohydromonas caseinilytica]NML15979.1 NAD-dependent epimerase/dehydratase family protein [Azohydromonas caseinilytica]
MSTPAPSTALILGANGRLGLAAAQAFAAAGWQVLAQVRREAAPGMPASARVLRTPVTDTAALAAQAAGARVVLHALNPTQYGRWERDALPLLRAGLDLAQALDARLMLPGNVYNYGTALSLSTPEDAPQQPHTVHGRIRVAMEAEIERRCRAGQLRATVLTAGDFFGAGHGTWFDQAILKSMAQGKLVYPGPLDVPHAWAYLPDLARSFVQLAARDDLPAFARYHHAGHTLTGTQLLDGIERAAAQLGLRPAQGFRRGGVPWGLIRVLGLVAPTLRALASMSYLWRLPHGLDDTRLRALPGHLPGTPLDLALEDTLRGLAGSAVRPSPSSCQPAAPAGAATRT